MDVGCGCLSGSAVFSVLGLSTSLTNGSGECGDPEGDCLISWIVLAIRKNKDEASSSVQI